MGVTSMLLMPPNEALLNDILRQVSRSIYLSLRVLPRSLSRPIGLAYLFCRAADTIADTELLAREQRLIYLDCYRGAFAETCSEASLIQIREIKESAQRTSAEGNLLWHLDDCFALLAQLQPDDQQRICQLVLTLTQGMQMDLNTFPNESEGIIAALETQADLDRYTYYVAGCVGEFWTRMIVAHRPALARWHLLAMEEKGIRFGKGLQMTNILRDLSHDLRLGRCYLPREDLRIHGITPEDLLDPSSFTKLCPLLGKLLAHTLEYYQSGWTYTLAIPRQETRLRLACIWPLLIGLRTLALTSRSPYLLDPAARVRISRSAVYRILLGSFSMVWFDQGLDCYYRRLSGSVLKSISYATAGT